MQTIRMNIHHLAPNDARTLLAIAQCYGAQFGRSLSGAIQIVLPGSLVDHFLSTVNRDVLPIELHKYS